jgi:hypothetical protein
VGELAQRRGGFFGENRQDNVMAIPAGAAARRFPEAEATVLYARAEPARREEAYRQTEAILRRLRQVPPDQPNDFTLSTSDQIIQTFDRVGAVIGLATVALAAVSLLIGGIGIANVMVIAVTERTREIGVRLAIGARRRERAAPVPAGGRAALDRRRRAGATIAMLLVSSRRSRSRASRPSRRPGPSSQASLRPRRPVSSRATCRPAVRRGTGSGGSAEI